LKFFFDGKRKIRPLLQAAGSDVYVPSAHGLSLVPYTGADRDNLDINGELAKRRFNISFFSFLDPLLAVVALSTSHTPIVIMEPRRRISLLFSARTSTFLIE
jgi:hypothetical protein